MTEQNLTKLDQARKRLLELGRQVEETTKSGHGELWLRVKFTDYTIQEIRHGIEHIDK